MFGNMSKLVFVRGINDVASAVAHRLFLDGYSVCVHESTQPTSTRRLMSFTDAIFDGSFTLEGVSAERVDKIPHLQALLAERRSIPVAPIDFPTLLNTLQPAILVDARMRKHHQPEAQLGFAPLTIGLGPNFVAGETVDAVIETDWGEFMGRVFWEGSSSPFTGKHRSVEGHARDRYIYAPLNGVFRTSRRIGDRVTKGDEVARIENVPLRALISGTLRGLTHDGVPVTEKTKVVEIDPRETGAQISGIGERPARVAQGVLEAIQSWQARGGN